MLPISSPPIQLFQPIRYATTELIDKRINIDSLRHQRSDFSIMVVLFQSGLIFRNLTRFKQADDELNTHMEREGEFALEEYLNKIRLNSRPVIYTKEPMPMHRPIDLASDALQHVVIEKSLASLLPITAIDLVNDYAEEHASIFASQTMWTTPDQCSFKRKMLRKAVEYGQEEVLNEIFEELRRINQPIDLSYVDLSSMNLTKFNWSGVNLTHANLTQTNLTQVNLSHADLSFADLTSANLYGAVMHKARLIGADLTLANCEHADLSEANLSRAILHRANMRSSTLSRSNLSGATMIRIDLNRAGLDRADLQNANLTNASMVGAILFRANLTDAQMGFSYLAQANLEQANLTDAYLQGACLLNARLHDATLTRTSFWNASLAVANGFDDIPDGIEKATANLSRFAPRILLHQRRIVTESALSKEIPTSLIDLINAYEGHTESREIQTFSEHAERLAAHFKNPQTDYARFRSVEHRPENRELVIDALISGDVRLKGEIIRSLISRNKLACLNKIFAEIRSLHGQITLAYVDLRNLNLSNVDLSFSNLFGANLSGGKFSHSRLSHLNLESANLSAAVFSHTLMSRVVLLDANLSGATFTKCVIEFSVLELANFTGATIRARFHRNWMGFADFSKAQLSLTQITRSHLVEVNLTDAILDGVNIRNSVLKNVKSNNVRLIDTSKNKVSITEPAQLND